MPHNPKPIKIRMIEQDLDGEKLAMEAGVSRPTVSRIVNGKQVMPESLQKVLAVLNLSMGEVYSAKPETENAHA